MRKNIDRRTHANAGLPPKPIMGFDLNGVLAEANIPLCQDIKKIFGIEINPYVETYGEIGKRLAEYRNIKDGWLANYINSPEFILKLNPIEGAQETWAKLQEYNLKVVTGHAYKAETATNEWLRLKGFHVKADFTKYKDSWCHQVKAKYLVEDSPIHAIEVSEAGTTVLLLDKSYNRKCEGANIIRIQSLSDIISLDV
jgi:uncharacterized HAD superfamily protein